MSDYNIGDFNMTEKKIEKQYTQVEVVFEAFDGTEFRDRDQCEAYEKSAACAVGARFLAKAKKLEAKKDSLGTPIRDDMYYALRLMDALTEDSSDCADFYRWTPESEDDVRNYLQWCKLKFGCSGYAASDENGQDNYFGRYSHRCLLKGIQPGNAYILYVNEESQWVCAYEMSRLLSAVTMMTETLDKGE